MLGSEGPVGVWSTAVLCALALIEWSLPLLPWLRLLEIALIAFQVISAYIISINVPDRCDEAYSL
jgi:hypothetical protein